MPALENVAPVHVSGSEAESFSLEIEVWANAT